MNKEMCLAKVYYPTFVIGVKTGDDIRYVRCAAKKSEYYIDCLEQLGYVGLNIFECNWMDYNKVKECVEGVL